MPKPSFKYRGRSDESVSRRAKQPSGSYDSFVDGEVLWFKPHDGENCIRILPRSPQEDFEKWGDHWGIDIFIHYDVGPDNGTYLCSDKMNGDPCPVCEARRGAEEEEADKLKASNRILCWLVDRKDEKSGPKLWSMPLGTSKDISAASQVKGSGEVLLIDHPEDGYDVYFDREGEKIRTKYKRVEVARDPSPLNDNEKIQARWLEYIQDNALPDILKYYDSDYIEKVLFGQGSSKDEDEDTRPARRRGGRAEEEAAEEAPSRGRGRRGRDDEEDAPEPSRSRRRGREEPEEEAEDAAPPRRRGRGAPSEEEAEAEVSSPRRRGRAKPEPEEEPDDPPPRRRGRAAEPEEEDEAPKGRTRHRPRAEPEDEPAEEDDDADGARTAEVAKGRLSRLGRRGGK